MGKILQQLYRGDLCPAENTIRGNAEYDALTRQSMDDFNRFTDKLDRDMKEEFDLLMEEGGTGITFESRNKDDLRMKL